MGNQLDVDIFKLTDRLMHIGFSLESLAGSYSMEREVNYLINKIEDYYKEFLSIEKEIYSLLVKVKARPTKLSKEQLKALWVKLNSLFIKIKPTLKEYKPHVNKYVRGPFDTIEELIPEVNMLFNSIM